MLNHFKYSILLSIMICSACGSGANSDGSVLLNPVNDPGQTGNDPLVPTLAIESRLPDIGDINVDRYTSISVVFKNDVDESTITSRSLELEGPLGLLTTTEATYEASTKTLSLHQLPALLLNSTYTVWLRQGITDATGTRLQEDMSWSFVTGSSVWSDALKIHHSSLSAGAPKVAVSLDGRATAVWHVTGGRAQVIHGTEFDDHRQWQLPEVIGSKSDQNFIYPRVDRADNGFAFVVWEEDIRTDDAGAPYNIWGRRYIPGSGWGVQHKVDDSNDEDCGCPQVAMDDVGNAMMVYRCWSRQNRNYYVYGRFYDVTESAYGERARLGSSDVYLSCPDVAMDHSANSMVVWTNQNGEVVSRSYSSQDDYWSARKVLSRANQDNASEPQIAMQTTGEAQVVWQSDLLNCGNDCRAEARRFDGTNWQSNVRQLTKKDQPHFPQVAVNDAGDAIAVWINGGKLKMARFDLINDWQSPETVDEIEEDISTEPPQVNVDRVGNATIVWNRFDISEQNWFVHARTHHPELGFSDLVRLADYQSVGCYGIDLSGNAHGQGVIVWQQNEDIYASTN